MKTYLFKTTTTMKEYNQKKYWIYSDIIGEIKVKADSLDSALLKYRDKVAEKSFIGISQNALKNKENMYIDTEDGTKQCGYVITGSCQFNDDSSRKETTQYVDLWVTINVLSDADFDSAEKEDEAEIFKRQNAELVSLVNSCISELLESAEDWYREELLDVIGTDKEQLQRLGIAKYICDSF